MYIFKNTLTNNIFTTENLNQSTDCLNITETEEGANFILDLAKTAKLSQLKSNRDIALSENFNIVLDETSTQVSVKKSDQSVILARISRLENGGFITAEWSDINDNRIELDLAAFKSLRNHMDVRDQTIYQLYFVLKNQIQACETLEELENININFE